MVTVQTEHLDDHTARLTVQVEPERIEKAMRQTARELAKKMRIPGFRPGKAPFNVVMRMAGREYVLSEALDRIMDDIYKEALEAAEIEPYAPGELEEMEEEDGLRLVFRVAKQPEVELGDYRSIRVEHEVPEVTDEMIEQSIESLRASFAETEDVDRPAEDGDLVLFEHLEITTIEDDENAADDDPGKTNGEASSDQEADADDARKGPRVVLHEHNVGFVIRSDSEEDFLPGLSQKFIGAKAGETLEFEMTVPEDFEDEELAGRRVLVNARVDHVQSRTLPELDEEFVKRASDGAFETLDELREDIRHHTEETLRREADAEAFREALDKMVEQATLHYPPQMVEEVVDDQLSSLEQDLQKQYGLSLENYLAITGKSVEELREQFQEEATRRVERGLVLSEFGRAEQLTVSDTAIDKRVEELLAQLLPEETDAERLDGVRAVLDMPESRRNIAASLLEEQITRHLLAIATGEEPPVGGVQEEAEAEADEAEAASENESNESTETPAEAEADEAAQPEADESPAESE